MPEQHLPRLAHQRSYFSLSWTHKSDVQLSSNQIPIWGQLACCKCRHSHCPLQESSSVKPSRMRGTPALQCRATEQSGFSVWDIQQNAPSWHFFTMSALSSSVAYKQAPSATPHVSKRCLIEHITSYTPGKRHTDISHLSPWPKKQHDPWLPSSGQSLSSCIPLWWRKPWPTASLFGAATCKKNPTPPSILCLEGQSRPL